MSAEKVIDIEGIEGQVIGLTPDEDSLIVRLSDHAEVEVPVRQLKEAERGLFLSARLRDMRRSKVDAVTVPVIREEAKIEKRMVDKRKVRIRKLVHEREEEVRMQLKRETVEIKTVPVDRIFNEPAQTREENGVLIIPIQEEIIVIEKRYRVREEVRVQRKTETFEQPTKVSILSEEVKVEKEDI